MNISYRHWLIALSMAFAIQLTLLRLLPANIPIQSLTTTYALPLALNIISTKEHQTPSQKGTPYNHPKPTIEPDSAPPRALSPEPTPTPTPTPTLMTVDEETLIRKITKDSVWKFAPETQKKVTQAALTPEHNQKKVAAKNKAQKDAEEQVKEAYMRHVLGLLEKHKFYPKRARRMRQQGVTWVFFKISQSNKITDIGLHKSSGYGILDKASLNFLRRPLSLPILPTGISNEFIVPIRYSLK